MTEIEKEIEALKRVDHPAIMRFYEVIETASQTMLVMEYCRGKSLQYLISDKRRLSESMAREVFRQLISAITYLHSRGVVHRDIKPENVIVSGSNDQPVVKLIDFGFSAIVPSNQTAAAVVSGICGTPAFMAPEMLANDGSGYLARPIDVWSAGIVLYLMLVGKVPFEASNKTYLFKKIKNGRYEIPKWVSKDARVLLSKMLVTNPDKRSRADEVGRNAWVLTNQAHDTTAAVPRSFFVAKEQQLDEKILANMDGIDTKRIRADLAHEEHNGLTTWYRLLHEKYATSPSCELPKIGSLDASQFSQFLQKRIASLST